LWILAAQSGTGDDAVMELIEATIELMAKLSGKGFSIAVMI
jgi:hypothetical protein